MRKAVPVLSAVLMVSFAGLAAAGRTSAQTGAKSAAKPAGESFAKAKKIYPVDCAICHGDNGNGKTDLATGMNLKLLDWTDPKALADKQDQELFDVIRKGKGQMPPEDENRAKDEDIKNLILYIRSMSKDQPVHPTQ